LALLPFAAAAESAPSEACGPAALTPEQFDRMYKRLMGKWRMNIAKSTFLTGNPPKNPSSFIYTAEPDNALGFKNENGKTAQKFDGKFTDASPTIPGTMLARVLLDEFTVENILMRNGKVANRNMQIYAPDGTVVIYISRAVS